MAVILYIAVSSEVCCIEIIEELMHMPGLPLNPASKKKDIDIEGNISGLI